MSSANAITIHANGKPYEVASGTSLADFLQSRSLKPGQVVVERNGDALTPGEVAKTGLADGDRLEIVRIVAGG